MKIIKKEAHKVPFELDKLYEFYMNSEYAELSQDTIEKVLKATLTSVAISSKEFIPLKLASLVAEIDWQWMTNRGALHKRIGKWLKDKHNITIDETLSTAIGNIVRESVVKEQTYYFDFVDKFQWEAGEFADDESCFWLSSRKAVRPAFEADPRIFAIRFFKKKKQSVIKKTKGKDIYYADKEFYYQGIGRAWLAVEAVAGKSSGSDKNKEETLFVIFNGYGLTSGQIASIFANYTSLTTNRVGLLNNNSYDDEVYANEGGILVGDSGLVGQIRNYDLSIPTRHGHSVRGCGIIDIHGSMDKKQLEYDGPGIWGLKRQHQSIMPYYSKFNSYRVKEGIVGDDVSRISLSNEVRGRVDEPVWATRYHPDWGEPHL